MNKYTHWFASDQPPARGGMYEVRTLTADIGFLMFAESGVWLDKFGNEVAPKWFDSWRGLTRDEYLKFARIRCRKCAGEMKRGIAIAQTFTSGSPDFPSDTRGITMSQAVQVSLSTAASVRCAGGV